MPEHVILERFNYRQEAEMLRGVLEAAGIEAFVLADDLGAVDPALGLIQGIQLVVAEADADRARDVLSEAATDAPDEGPGEDPGNAPG